MDCVLKIVPLISVLLWSSVHYSTGIFPRIDLLLAADRSVVNEGDRVNLTCSVGHAHNMDTIIYFERGSAEQHLSMCQIQHQDSRCWGTNTPDNAGYNCSCRLDKTEPNYDWTYYDMIIDRANIQDAGPWQCRTLNVTSTSVTLNVQDAPNVTVYSEFSGHNNSVKIICEAMGRPPEHQFSNFTHFWGGQKIREIAGKSEPPNRYVLIIQPYSYKDSGTYECTVSNNVTGLNNEKEQTGNQSISMHVRPVLLDVSKQTDTINAILGQNLTLSKTIFSKNNIISHNWTNPRGHITHHNSEVNAVDVNLYIYNTEVKDTGYIFSLLIGQTQADDLGLHFLTVCNEFGCGEFYTNVVTTDIDECLVQTTCGTNANCTNTYGSYTCTCLNGYVQDGTTCAAVPLTSTAVETATIVLAVTTTALTILVIIMVVVIIRMRSNLADSKITFSDIRQDVENQATSVYEDGDDNNTVETSPSDIPVESSEDGRSAPTGEHDYQNEQGLTENNHQQTNTYERLDMDHTDKKGAYEKLNV